MLQAAACTASLHRDATDPTAAGAASTAPAPLQPRSPSPGSRCGAVLLTGCRSHVRAPRSARQLSLRRPVARARPAGPSPPAWARQGPRRAAELGPAASGPAWVSSADGRPRGRPFSASGPASHARVAHFTSTHSQGRPGPRPKAGVSPGGMAAVQSPGLTPRGFLQQALAQVDDLRLVSVLDLCVDTREHSLGNFGESPPRPHPPPPRPDHSPRVCPWVPALQALVFGPLHPSFQGSGISTGPGSAPGRSEWPRSLSRGLWVKQGHRLKGFYAPGAPALRAYGGGGVGCLGDQGRRLGWDPGFGSQLQGPGGLPSGCVGSGAPSVPCPACSA